MEESITAYQGKNFSVTLQSYLGSANYGWCLTSMPAGVILVGQSNESANGLSLVNQVFYFIAIDEPKKQSVELEFGLCCLTQNPSKLNPFKFEEKIKITVNIIPSNGQDGRSFVKYSENSAIYSPNNMDLMAALKYGYPPTLKYGYPCDQSDCANLKYGYPCNQNDMAALKYGYPCDQNDCANLKYGYPCSQNDMAALKYGYPCDQNDCANLKYGYPCSQNDMAALKYGYPPALKYGYPCDKGECE